MPGCHSGYDRTVSKYFFRFPSNRIFNKKWIVYTHRDYFEPYTSADVSEEHFANRAVIKEVIKEDSLARLNGNVLISKNNPTINYG